VVDKSSVKKIRFVIVTSVRGKPSGLPLWP
jgi:hypothetical protein